MSIISFEHSCNQIFQEGMNHGSGLIVGITVEFSQAFSRAVTESMLESRLAHEATLK